MDPIREDRTVVHGDRKASFQDEEDAALALADGTSRDLVRELRAELAEAQTRQDVQAWAPWVPLSVACQT